MTDIVQGHEGESISLSAIALVLLRRAKLIVGVTLGLAMLTSFSGLSAPRTYTSTATFFPQARRSATSLSGLAAQFGVAIQGEAAQSTQFYVDLITTRAVLGSVADSTLTFTSDTGRVVATLSQILEIEGSDPIVVRDLTIRQLTRMVSATQSTRSGVISLKVSAPSAPLAKALADRVLGEVTRFNLETRNSQAAAERAFAERRLADVRLALRESEQRMQSFLEQNRALLSSPQLLFQRDRLQRDLTLQQAIFTQLTASVENAKIEEVRDTPVLTIVNAPELPVRPEPRGLVLRGVTALVVGSFLGVLLALLAAGLDRLREDDSDRMRAIRAFMDRIPEPAGRFARRLVARRGPPAE